MLSHRGVLSVLLLSFTAQAAEYRVGPGQALASIGEVPWESLQPGDTVFIHARPTPYREKWVLGVRGTATAPITVRGVPDSAGKLPVIDGEQATTRSQLNFWNEQRGIVKIGGANRPPDTMPAYLVVENLHLRNARGSFTGRGGASSYNTNAASIFIEKGEHITIRGCILEASGNGLFIASEASDILVERNDIRGNGNTGSIYEHNAYTEALGITYQFNRFGPLCLGCLGNNLKDRSGGTVIRYNWIEGGNRQLDLVDSDSAAIRADPSYARTFVYGNVLIEPAGAGNAQIIHFGGDGSATGNYRSQLYLYNNTIVSLRTDRATLVRLSTNAQLAHVTSNVFASEQGTARSLSLTDAAGTLRHGGNWYTTGYVNTFGTLTGTVEETAPNLQGTLPGFVNLAGQDFHLTASSSLRGAAVARPPEAASHPVEWQYVTHLAAEPRSVSSPGHIGAFGDPAEPGPGNPDAGAPDGGAGPGPATPGKSDDGGCGATGGGFAAPLGLLMLAALALRRTWTRT
ncbi:right-handed parallel beta-helix repeat-containing protein [Myxococcus stipitatus]|uniref:right-handed parallel beta-helix repeat-containing protein n=1 Tax=Myxococcus stipitatus TaxID=83455 RepID=UPI0030D4ADD3